MNALKVGVISSEGSCKSINVYPLWQRFPKCAPRDISKFRGTHRTVVIELFGPNYLIYEGVLISP